MDPKTRALMMIDKAALPPTTVAQPSSTAVAGFRFNPEIAKVTSRGSALFPLMEMANKYGNPRIDVVNDRDYRANYNPMSNTMTVRKHHVDDVIAELAHAKQFAGIRFPVEYVHGYYDRARALLLNNDIEAQYETPGSNEYTAHKITEPQLNDELRDRVFARGMIREKLFGYD